MTHHACHLSLDSYTMKMITICHHAVKMMHHPTSTLKWSSIIAASYKLGTEIIWLVLEEECSTTPVALPSLNKYGMLLLLFSVCMEEQLNVSKKKNHKNVPTFFFPLWNLQDSIQSAFKLLFDTAGCCYLWNIRSLVVGITFLIVVSWLLCLLRTPPWFYIFLLKCHRATKIYRDTLMYVFLFR